MIRWTTYSTKSLVSQVVILPAIFWEHGRLDPVEYIRNPHVLVRYMLNHRNNNIKRPRNVLILLNCDKYDTSCRNTNFSCRINRATLNSLVSTCFVLKYSFIISEKYCSVYFTNYQYIRMKTGIVYRRFLGAPGPRRADYMRRVVRPTPLSLLPTFINESINKDESFIQKSAAWYTTTISLLNQRINTTKFWKYSAESWLLILIPR